VRSSGRGSKRPGPGRGGAIAQLAPCGRTLDADADRAQQAGRYALLVAEARQGLVAGLGAGAQGVAPGGGDVDLDRVAGWFDLAALP
jgi:hypothetical protein